MAEKHVINTKWISDMTFEADVDGYKIMMDAKPESGGHDAGSSPKKLMLVALSGCTGMDVVSV